MTDNAGSQYSDTVEHDTPQTSARHGVSVNPAAAHSKRGSDALSFSASISSLPLFRPH